MLFEGCGACARCNVEREGHRPKASDRAAGHRCLEPAEFVHAHQGRRGTGATPPGFRGESRPRSTIAARTEMLVTLRSNDHSAVKDQPNAGHDCTRRPNRPSPCATPGSQRPCSQHPGRARTARYRRVLVPDRYTEASVPFWSAEARQRPLTPFDARPSTIRARADPLGPECWTPQLAPARSIPLPTPRPCPSVLRSSSKTASIVDRCSPAAGSSGS